MQRSRQQLAQLLVEHSYLEAREAVFLLASGQRSRVYFDCRRTTFRAEAMPLVGRAFIDEFLEHGVVPEAVGGLTSGADPIALAIARASMDLLPAHALPHPIDSFSVRKEPKDHGTGQWIEGCAARGARVAIVDDVVTSGGSVLAAIERCRQEGLEIVQVVLLVDREAGGLGAIRRAVPGIPVSSIFTGSALQERRSETGSGPSAGPRG